jgi:hypothetical protein
MSGITKKPLSDVDAQQTQQSAFNDNTFSHLVDGYLSALVGRRIDLAITTTTVSGDTEVYTFSENGTQLLVLTLVYTDGTRATLLYAERTS